MPGVNKNIYLFLVPAHPGTQAETLIPTLIPTLSAQKNEKMNTTDFRGIKKT